ncbi:hypothetical protein FOPG_11865 [Fusarium oxysporum f. sp. conglutinans race 2 54008]|uniref:Uncharacterized protein n=1 Tax=Fusarium oxysporum f. sp. conglutinans race 2 54008 TaxID=1089457 RepID=X0H978_FUSOX|nr:hypothetical protein FOPG_11865 [Fusarium oxysporum f. sp. conglutinans race 2 54008]EXL72609.1 hypothetical protein FOPG_11865 [Fusarium oxysporum f. sp. conglutinans race 2 54008]EXL72610.1 hypothetical protein FOPG_11865 [Fusarium oxysporum f. sp. conglutinans race 2 54008]EXL72611.1 hypothetical protein FOPG_11865 [Fusarium oxysporum f. sp. conglutinans race 2 54008]
MGKAESMELVLGRLLNWYDAVDWMVLGSTVCACATLCWLVDWDDRGEMSTRILSLTMKSECCIPMLSKMLSSDKSYSKFIMLLMSVPPAEGEESVVCDDELVSPCSTETVGCTCLEGGRPVGRALLVTHSMPDLRHLRHASVE